MPQPTIISFVRHGLVHNPRAVVYGRLPRFGLSEAGRRQAQAAANYLKPHPFVALFSSPMLRARQTARIIQAARPELPLRISAYLNEVHNPFEGISLHEMEARGWDLYTGVTAPYEQPADILRRIQAFIARTRRHYPSQQVVAVTHGDPILFLIRWVKQAPNVKQNLAELGLPDSYPLPASITTLTYHTTAADERPGLEYVRPYEL